MIFAPEFKIMILNAAIIGIAYLGIYPGLQQKTLNRIIGVDLVLTMLALGVAGALFWGSGLGFNMILFDANWAVFSFVTMALMEAPLCLRFCRKHGINLSGR